MSADGPQGVGKHLSQQGLVAIIWVGVALGVCFTAIRIAIRLKIRRRLAPDDYCVLIALAFLITNAILQTIQAPSIYYVVFNPTGPDIVSNVMRYTYLEFVTIGLFWTVLWSVKASFLALFWGIFRELPQPHYRYAWWVVSVFAGLAYVGCWLASIFTCHPPADYFRFGKCLKPIDHEGSVIAISYTTAVDITSDVMIALLPQHLIWRSRLNRQQKIGLAIIFSLGIIIVLIAIIRAIEIEGKAYTDPVGLALWGIVESSISMIVGCLPPFKALIPSTFSHHSPSPDTGTWGRGWYHFNWNFNFNSNSPSNNDSNNRNSRSPLSSRNQTKRSLATVTTSQSEEQLPIQLGDYDAQENPKYGYDRYGIQQGGGKMVDIVDDYGHDRHTNPDQTSKTANEISFYNEFTDEETSETGGR